MSYAMFAPVYTPALNTDGPRREISGSFKPNGSSAIVAASNTGKGFTVARTGTGTFVVTLVDPTTAFDSAWVNLESATLGVGVQFTAEPTAGTAGTLTIKTWVATVVDSAPVYTATDLAADTNTRIFFGFRLTGTAGNTQTT